MKILKYLFSISIIIATQSMYAQQHYAHIDSIYIIPNNPKSYDEVKVVCLSRSATYPLWLDTFSLNIQLEEISLIAYYYKGPAQMPSGSIDTINIGKLNAGDYSLNFKVEAKYYIDTSHTYDMDTLNFTVSESNVLVNKSGKLIAFSLYPNPASDNLTIEFNLKVQKQLIIEINDLAGRQVLSKEYFAVVNANSISIDTKHLTPGTYILNINSVQGKLASGKFIKIE